MYLMYLLNCLGLQHSHVCPIFNLGEAICVTTCCMRRALVIMFDRPQNQITIEDVDDVLYNTVSCTYCGDNSKELSHYFSLFYPSAVSCTSCAAPWQSYIYTIAPKHKCKLAYNVNKGVRLTMVKDKQKCKILVKNSLYCCTMLHQVYWPVLVDFPKATCFAFC